MDSWVYLVSKILTTSIINKSIYYINIFTTAKNKQHFLKNLQHFFSNFIFFATKQLKHTILTTDSHLNCKSNRCVNYTSFILFGVIDASLLIVNCKLLIVNCKIVSKKLDSWKNIFTLNCLIYQNCYLYKLGIQLLICQNKYSIMYKRELQDLLIKGTSINSTF